MMTWSAWPDDQRAATEVPRNSGHPPGAVRKRDRELGGRHPGNPLWWILTNHLGLNWSAHHVDRVAGRSAPEDGIGAAIEVVEYVFDPGAGVE